MSSPPKKDLHGHMQSVVSAVDVDCTGTAKKSFDRLAAEAFRNEPPGQTQFVNTHGKGWQDFRNGQGIDYPLRCRANPATAAHHVLKVEYLKRDTWLFFRSRFWRTLFETGSAAITFVGGWCKHRCGANCRRSELNRLFSKRSTWVHRPIFIYNPCI
jgi:hypothetical protein